LFTGIVEERGTVLVAGSRLEVASRTVVRDSDAGASVAVNGVCLTVVVGNQPADARADGSMAFDVSPETLARSSLGALAPGDPVNLERPLTLLARLGGHLVQGHVDGVGRVVAARDPPTGASAGRTMSVEVPEGLVRYVVEKGSIAVDGVSLTVARVDGARFDVALVPFTLRATTLGTTHPGDSVNVEVDVMAKYVERLLRRS
jgi:riboflavin synthase